MSCYFQLNILGIRLLMMSLCALYCDVLSTNKLRKCSTLPGICVSELNRQQSYREWKIFQSAAVAVMYSLWKSKSRISRSVILGTVVMSVWSVHGVTMWLAAFNPARKQDLQPHIKSSSWTDLKWTEMTFFLKRKEKRKHESPKWPHLLCVVSWDFRT